MTEEKTFGRYQIREKLGEGGFGAVFHAFDPRFKRDVALKVLPRQSLDNPELKMRFEREAQTVAILEHAAIVPVYDFGEENEQPYLVMRYLSGGTLSQRLQQDPLPMPEIIRIISRLAPALTEAHNKGIIHRDLKPDNIMFDRRDDPFITDFGLAKLNQSSVMMTSGNVVMGTPAYMSPEQARGESVIDGRSDIYALGVILFEMLTGQLPFQSSTPVGMVMKHIMEPVPRILTVNPNLPSGCESVINQAMAKEPKDRFPSAIHFANSLIVSAQQASGGSPTGAPLTGGLTPIPIPIPIPIPLPSPPPDSTKQDNTVDLPATPVQAQPQPAQAEVSPPGQILQALTCPNCAAPLPNSLMPNQPVECRSCGSRFMVTLPEPDPTVICPTCQTNNADTLKYCANCGGRLKVDCVRCHTKNRIDTVHCIKCGTNLQAAEDRRREIEENRQRMQEEREQALKEKKARQQKEKIIRLLDSLENPNQHEFAIYQLTQMNDAPISALSRALLKHNNTNVRFGCAIALGQICTNHELKTFSKAKAIKTLIKALNDPESIVRNYSTEALGNLSGKQAQLAVEPLGGLLKDKNESVRKQAKASLEKIGGPRAEDILNNSGGIIGWFKG